MMFTVLAFIVILCSVQAQDHVLVNPEVTAVEKNATCRKPGIEYPKAIEFGELKEGLSAGTLIVIDVRNPWELLEFGELEGSFNIPLPDFASAFQLTNEAFLDRYKFQKPTPNDKNVILTCRSGRRVLVAYDLLEPKGYCNIRVYLGSYLDWKEKGGPLIFRKASLQEQPTTI